MRLIEEKTQIFGPKRKGPNILINKYLRKEDSFFQKIYYLAEKYLQIPNIVSDPAKAERRRKEDEEKFIQVHEILTQHDVTWKDMCNSFVTGFDIATQSGPLCEEPILGAVFLIDNLELVKKIGKVPVQMPSMENGA